MIEYGTVKDDGQIAATLEIESQLVGLLSLKLTVRPWK